MGNNFFKNTKNLLFYSVIFALLTSIYSCNPINIILPSDKPLIIAAKTNNLSAIKSLIKNKVNIDDEDKDGNTALNIAIINKNKEIIKFLIESKANLKTRNINYDSPIILALKNNDFETMKLLIDNDVEVDSKEINGNSLLHLACTLENKEIIGFLLDNGADITLTNRKYISAIELLNNPEIINFFIDKVSDKNLYPKLNYNYTVNFLIEKTNISIIEKFINKVEKIEPKAIDINNAFISSIVNEKKESIEFFLNKGANINTADSQGWTALMVAIKRNNIDIVNLLIKNNANVNLYTNSYFTIEYENKDIPIEKASSALIISVMLNNFEIFKTLIEAGADPNLKDSEGHNALAYTTTNFLKNNEKELKRYMAKTLIENGALLNTEFKFRRDRWITGYSSYNQIDPNFKGESFFIFVINDLEFLELIAKKSPNIFDQAINSSGYTPLMFAIHFAHNIDILEFIIKQTKNINLVDNENKTALDHAIKSSKKEAIDLLKQYGAK